LVPPIPPHPPPFGCQGGPLCAIIAISYIKKNIKKCLKRINFGPRLFRCPFMISFPSNLLLLLLLLLFLLMPNISFFFCNLKNPCGHWDSKHANLDIWIQNLIQNCNFQPFFLFLQVPCPLFPTYWLCTTPLKSYESYIILSLKILVRKSYPKFRNSFFF
jgi:hypothetical protein